MAGSLATQGSKMDWKILLQSVRLVLVGHRALPWLQQLGVHVRGAQAARSGVNGVVEMFLVVMICVDMTLFRAKTAASCALCQRIQPSRTKTPQMQVGPQAEVWRVAFVSE
jgi:hypothetical protein